MHYKAFIVFFEKNKKSIIVLAQRETSKYKDFVCLLHYDKISQSIAWIYFMSLFVLYLLSFPSEELQTKLISHNYIYFSILPNIREVSSIYNM